MAVAAATTGPSVGELQGRRAFVTGGASGIGAAIVRRLAAGGAMVAIADLQADAARVLADEVGGIAVTLDVTDFDAVNAAVRAHGPFDILVNSAGVDQHAYFTKTTPAEWRRLLSINLEAVFNTTHAVLPGMQAADYGRIVNVASEAGRLGSRGGAVYAASKGGVIAFTRCIAREKGA
jgi:2-hydroxycyclohexanecarboxyl-CoA dehydrogenase